MKKVFLPFLLAVTFILGCSTPDVVTTAVNVEGVAIPSVNLLMESWADYVKSGKATQAQVDAVKDAYVKYYNTELKASNTLTLYLNSTNANPVIPTAILSQAASNKADLVTLINTFKK